MRKPLSARSINCPNSLPRSTAALPYSSSVTSSRIPRPGATKTSTKQSLTCWKLPNDLSPATENQDQRPLGRDREPDLGWRGDISYPGQGLVDRTVPCGDRPCRR